MTNSLATPLTMDQLGYGEKKAIAVVGVAFGVAGLYNGALYGGLGFVARRSVDCRICYTN